MVRRGAQGELIVSNRCTLRFASLSLLPLLLHEASFVAYYTKAILDSSQLFLEFKAASRRQRVQAKDGGEAWPYVFNEFWVCQYRGGSGEDGHVSCRSLHASQTTRKRVGKPVFCNDSNRSGRRIARSVGRQL